MKFLIDSGASVNAVSKEALARTGLHPIIGKLPPTLVAANGGQIQTYGRCPPTHFHVGDWAEDSVNDFHVLDLPGIDAILGHPWLEKVNPKIDWAASTLTFAHTRSIRIIGRKEFEREVKGAEVFLFVIKEENHDSVPTTTDPEMAKILNEYSAVFPSELPNRLLPSRYGIDHAIDLIPNAKIPQRNPYRLSYAENLELQRQVADLLEKGLISPSNSPFASPVLFVRKKDGALRMCIDYRALNDVTVKDCFPLPHIGDLLDHLSKARYFSKMDLRSGYNQVLVKEADPPRPHSLPTKACTNTMSFLSDCAMHQAHSSD